MPSDNEEAKEQLKKEICAELGYSETSGLYAEKKRLEQMSKLSHNTEQHVVVKRTLHGQLLKYANILIDRLDKYEIF